MNARVKTKKKEEKKRGVEMGQLTVVKIVQSYEKTVPFLRSLWEGAEGRGGERGIGGEAGNGEELSENEK